MTFCVAITAPTRAPAGLFFVFYYKTVTVYTVVLPNVSNDFVLILLNGCRCVVSTVGGLSFLALNIFTINTFLKVAAFSHILSCTLGRIHGVALTMLSNFVLNSLGGI